MGLMGSCVMYSACSAWINLMQELCTSLMISRMCGSSGSGCVNQLGMLSRQSLTLTSQDDWSQNMGMEPLEDKQKHHPLHLPVPFGVSYGNEIVSFVRCFYKCLSPVPFLLISLNFRQGILFLPWQKEVFIEPSFRISQVLLSGDAKNSTHWFNLQSSFKVFCTC